MHETRGSAEMHEMTSIYNNEHNPQEAAGNIGGISNGF